MFVVSSNPPPFLNVACSLVHWTTSTLTTFEPFSFDVLDAARKVERERRLQEMRQMQEQQWVRMLSSEVCHSEDSVNYQGPYSPNILS